MSLFKIIANKGKDLALQIVAAWIVNKYHLNKLGQMTALRLDSENKKSSSRWIYTANKLQNELTIQYRLLSSTLIEIADV